MCNNETIFLINWRKYATPIFIIWHCNVIKDLFNLINGLENISHLLADLFLRQSHQSQSNLLLLREHKSARVLTEAVKRFQINVNSHLNRASGFILNTFLECDRRGVDNLAAHPRTKHLPVFCVGPIFPPENQAKFSTNTTVTEQVTKWLDGQAEHSVVYISFGSLAALTTTQTTVMGQALLSLGRPFIYSISSERQVALPDAIRSRIAALTACDVSLKSKNAKHEENYQFQILNSKRKMWLFSYDVIVSGKTRPLGFFLNFEACFFYKTSMCQFCQKKMSVRKMNSTFLKFTLWSFPAKQRWPFNPIFIFFCVIWQIVLFPLKT